MNNTTKILGGLCVGLLVVVAVLATVLVLNRPEPQGQMVGATVLSGGNDSFEAPIAGKDIFRTYTFFASSTTQTLFGTSTTATSTNIIAWNTSDGRRVDGKFVVAGAKKVTMLFGRGDASGTGNTGKSKFTVQTSPDGTNWYEFNKLLTATSSISATGGTVNTLKIWLPYVEVGTGINFATGTVSASLDLTDESIYAIRCIVIETTNGDHFCRASAEW